MPNLSRFIPVVFLILLTVLLLWWRFPDFFSHGNTRFIEPWGDGYKTYFAAFYHIQHDSTYQHFEGMNYPYGEHVVPGDCQPLFSTPLKWLHGQGVDVARYQLGLFHGFLLLGLVLAVVFLYLIFRRLRLPVVYSMAVALGLVALAPQMSRLVSHYGLAHPELLPLVFYLLLRWHERPHWHWSLAIGVVVWAYSLVHFYYFAITAFAIVGWVGVRWLARRDWPQTLTYLGHGALMLLLPFAFFYAWMLHPDTVSDRNPVPWGFFAYRSEFSGVFTDLSQPHWQWVDTHVSKIYRTDMEGLAYVGLVAMAFLLVALFRLATRRRLGGTPARALHDQYLGYLLVSGAVILLFAVGLPFTWPGGKVLLSYTGPLQQFRSIGRFAWVFYYAANIAAFYYIYQWLAGRRGSWWKLALPVLLLWFEAFQFNTSRPIDLDVIENWAPGERFTDLDIDYSRYQACLPIPYFNIGSDNFWLGPQGWISQKPHTLALQAGLPLTSAMLTRTSLAQTISQLQLVTEPYRRPRILDDYPTDQPLLLFWDKERVLEHGDKFLHLNTHARLLYEKDWMQLYELPLANFDQHIADKVAAVTAHIDTLPTRPGGWRTSTPVMHWIYDTFDARTGSGAYLGAGLVQANMADTTTLLDTVWATDFVGELTVSFWQYVEDDRAARTTLTWTEYDANTGAQLHTSERQTHGYTKVFDPNGWGLVEFKVPRQQAGSRLVFTIVNNDKNTGTLRVDELLVRPRWHTVAQHRPNGIWWNNRWYPK